MNWNFAIINNRLAEIYLKKTGKKIKILGHCYVDRKDYKTQKEKQWLEKDAAEYRFIYRKGIYRKIACAKNSPSKADKFQRCGWDHRAPACPERSRGELTH